MLISIEGPSVEISAEFGARSDSGKFVEGIYFEDNSAKLDQASSCNEIPRQVDVPF